MAQGPGVKMLSVLFLSLTIVASFASGASGPYNPGKNDQYASKSYGQESHYNRPQCKLMDLPHGYDALLQAETTSLVDSIAEAVFSKIETYLKGDYNNDGYKEDYKPPTPASPY